MNPRHAWLPFLVLPALFLAVFFFYPLGRVLFMAFTAGGQAGAAELWSRVLPPLGFTFYQAALSTLLTLAVGLPGAYLFARFTFPGKRLLRILTMLPFILPTVVAAVGFNALIGPRGLLNLVLMGWFGLETPPIQVINTLWAILLGHVFYNTSVVIRVVGSAWEQLDSRLPDAARVLGATPAAAFAEVTLPLLHPAIFASALLVFLFDFTSFGVVLLLGGPAYATLEVEIYTQTLQMLNLPLAGLLSAVQLGCTLLLTAAYILLAGKQRTPLMPRLQGEGQRPPRRWWERLVVAALVLVLLGLLVAPLGALALRSVARLEPNRGERAGFEAGWTLDYYRELFINRRQSVFYVPPLAAVSNSLLYAAATVALALPLGMLAAYALTRQNRASRWLDPLLMLPLGASAVTLGLGYLLVFNRPPLDVRSSPLLVPLAHSLVALPFVVRTLQPALLSIPENLRGAARVLGASPWRAWREVDLPILGRAALVGAIFSFTISLGEFGATSFLARPEYPTLPVAIFRFLGQPGALNYGQALAMATLLLLICAASIFALDRL